MDGKETQIPTLVPTLSESEKSWLLSWKEGQKIPRPIIDKAIKHARMRQKKGLSPFAN